MGMPEMLPLSGAEITERRVASVWSKYGRPFRFIPACGLTGPMLASREPSVATTPAV